MGGVADVVAADDVGYGCLDVRLSNSTARKSAQGCPRVGSRQLPRQSRTAGIGDSSDRAAKGKRVDGKVRIYSLQCARSFCSTPPPKSKGLEGCSVSPTGLAQRAFPVSARRPDF